VRSNKKQTVLGFYKDRDGETRPITKSTAELNRPKVVRHPQQFHGVSPQDREKQMRERQRVQVDSNLGKMDDFLQMLNKNLEQRGSEMEGLKREYDQAQSQQDLRKATGIQQRMNRLLFTVTSLGKKRDAVQAKIHELKGIRAKL
jgi:hypothetical protein